MNISQMNAAVTGCATVEDTYIIGAPGLPEDICEEIAGGDTEDNLRQNIFEGKCFGFYIDLNELVNKIDCRSELKAMLINEGILVMCK